MERIDERPDMEWNICSSASRILTQCDVNVYRGNKEVELRISARWNLLSQEIKDKVQFLTAVFIAVAFVSVYAISPAGELRYAHAAVHTTVTVGAAQHSAKFIGPTFTQVVLPHSGGAPLVATTPSCDASAPCPDPICNDWITSNTVRRRSNGLNLTFLAHGMVILTPRYVMIVWGGKYKYDKSRHLDVETVLATDKGWKFPPASGEIVVKKHEQALLCVTVPPVHVLTSSHQPTG